MKIKSILIISIVLLAGLFMTGNVAEAEFSMATPYGYILPYGGVSYNTLDLGYVESLMVDSYADIESVEQVSSTTGYYLGVNHWFENHNNDLGVGIEFEYLNTIKYERPDIEINNMELLLTGSYRLSAINELLPECIYLTGGIGLTQASLYWNDDETLAEGYEEPLFDLGIFRGPVLKFGLQGSYPVYKNIKLGGRANYRYSRPHSEGDLDLDGFELGAQVEIAF